MVKNWIVAVASAAALAATAAAAEPVRYAWTGFGANQLGATKCPTYKMTIDVAVDGTSVKGEFQQEGRDKRHFEAALDPKGVFKTKATIGGGSTMDVHGTISDKENKIVLDGYCKFEGKLTKK